MAFIQYLKFDDLNLPLPDSYDIDISDVEADSSGETEAGTTQRDVVRNGVLCSERKIRRKNLLMILIWKRKRNFSLLPQAR